MSETSLPIGKSITREELRRLFLKIEDKPYGNAGLAYSMLVPKNWNYDQLKAETAQLNTVQLKPLVIFEKEKAFIQLHAVKLVREIRASHWLRHYAAVTERKIVELKELSERFADSLLEFEIKGHTFSGRAAALIDGDRVFLLLCFAEQSAYPHLAEVFGLAVSSFKLKNPSSRPSIEPRAKYDLAGIVKFAYPASWTTRAPEQAPVGKQAVDLYHFDDDQVFQGLIRVKTVSRQAIAKTDELIEHTIEEFSESNLVLHDMLHTGPIPSENDHFSNGRVFIFNAHVQDNEENRQELWITIFEDANHYFVLSLLTPSRRDTFYVWAFNKRAYDIILGNIG